MINTKPASDFVSACKETQGYEPHVKKKCETIGTASHQDFKKHLRALESRIALTWEPIKILKYFIKPKEFGFATT